MLIPDPHQQASPICPQKEEKGTYDMGHVKCDKLYVTYDTWHMTWHMEGGKHSLKISAPYFFWFVSEGFLKIFLQQITQCSESFNE